MKVSLSKKTFEKVTLLICGLIILMAFFTGKHHKKEVKCETIKIRFLGKFPNVPKISKEVEKSFPEPKQSIEVEKSSPNLVESGQGNSLIEGEKVMRAKLEEWRTAEIQKEKQRREMIYRIDCYLSARNSPMTGLGSVFYDEAEKYGIEPRLSVAISEAESSCGQVCFASYNAWGMLAYPNGFSSWEEGIRTNIEWLHSYYGSPQSAYDCPGYCEPSHPWMENVQRVLESI